MEWLRIGCAFLGAILGLIGYTQDIAYLLVIGIILAVIGGLAILIIDLDILSHLSRE